MSTVGPHTIDRTEPRVETRIASYLLTEYLERLGVEVIFGLCGHTVIAFLDALGKSRIRFISTRHEQVAAHAADGYTGLSIEEVCMDEHVDAPITQIGHEEDVQEVLHLLNQLEDREAVVLKMRFGLTGED